MEQQSYLVSSPILALMDTLWPTPSPTLTHPRTWSVARPCTGREVYVLSDDDDRGIARCFNALAGSGEPHRSMAGDTEAYYPRSVSISLTACAEKPWARSMGHLASDHFEVYRQKNYEYKPLSFKDANAHLDKGAGRLSTLLAQPHPAGFTS